MLLRKFVSFFSKKSNIKTLFLVDILFMKDINAVYNFINGDYIIAQLNNILKTKTQHQINKVLKLNP